VSRHASEQDIKKAYKRLSRKYHPDKNNDPGAEDRFVEIAHGESGNHLVRFNINAIGQLMRFFRMQPWVQDTSLSADAI
jgi:hypothetical protein